MGLSTEIRDATIKAAVDINLEPALLLSVVQIESAGQPFEADGVTPHLLFERHVFWKELKARGTAAQLREAESKGLAHKGWRKSTQYKDQGTSFNRLSLLARAARINEDCAYRSASWGLGQTMGFLCEEIGYPSAPAMVDALKAGGVPEQIKAMVREIQRHGLDRKLAAKDFPGFARGYNGKGYEENAYDFKLAAAYTAWVKILTPANPDGEGYTLKMGDENKAVEDLQTRLREKNYLPGVIDGRFGKETELAVVAFQHANRLGGAPGVWLPEYDPVLRVDVGRFGDRGNASTKDVENVSTVGRGAGLVKRLLSWLGVGSLGGAAVEQTLPGTLAAFQSAVQPLISGFAWLTSNKPLFFGFLLLVGAMGAQQLLVWLRDQFRAGAYHGAAKPV